MLMSRFQVTQGIKADFGAVRRLYNAETGHRVTNILDLEDGKAYVAAGRGRFQSFPYTQIPDAKSKSKSGPAHPGELAPLPPVRGLRKVVRSGRARKEAQASRPIIITVLKNGETGPGVKLVLSKRDRITFDQVFRLIEERVQLFAEPIRKLVTLSGERVNKLAGIYDGAVLIAVGRRHKFKRALYQDMTEDAFGAAASTPAHHNDGSHQAHQPHQPHSLNNKAVLPVSASVFVCLCVCVCVCV